MEDEDRSRALAKTDSELTSLRISDNSEVRNQGATHLSVDKDD